MCAARIEFEGRQCRIAAQKNLSVSLSLSLWQGIWRARFIIAYGFDVKQPSTPERRFLLAVGRSSFGATLLYIRATRTIEYDTTMAAERILYTASPRFGCWNLYKGRSPPGFCPWRAVKCVPRLGEKMFSTDNRSDVKVVQDSPLTTDDPGPNWRI